MTARTLAVALLALICGGSAAVAVMKARAPQVVQSQEVATTMVVKAVVPIPRNARITEEMVALEPFPQEFVMPNTATKVEDVVGLRATFGFLAGESILMDKVGSGNPSGDIPVGMRTVSIQARAPRESGAGWIHPGDFVDVFLTLDDPEVNGGEALTVNLFQRMEVFAVGSTRGGSSPDRLEDTTSVTLLVAPAQVPAITLTEGRGSYTLALRSPDDDDEETVYQRTELADLPVMQELERLRKQRATEQEAERVALYTKWEKEWEEEWALKHPPQPPIESLPSEVVKEEVKEVAPEPDPEDYIWIYRGGGLSLQLLQPGDPRKLAKLVQPSP